VLEIREATPKTAAEEERSRRDVALKMD
jgi:hypothetical protein